VGSPVLNTSKLYKHQHILHTDQNLFEEEDILYQYTYNVSPQPNWRETSNTASAYTKQRHSFQPNDTPYQSTSCFPTHNTGLYQAHTSIIIKLKRVYLVNNITLELKNSSSQYTIQVSRDNKTWRQLIDYSRLMTCTGMQVLWFPKQAVRYHITLLPSLYIFHMLQALVIQFYTLLFLMQICAVCSII